MDNNPEQPAAASDAVLMERIRGGDRSALAMLLDRFWRPLVAFTSRIVGTVDDAEDVVLDVFVRIWQQRSSWSPSGSDRAYIYRIARNLALNALRDGGVEQRSRERGADNLTRVPSTPPEDFAARALRRDMEAAIAALPERRRQVFVLSRVHGMTHREIADIMSISPQTVANQMTAALDHLRSALAHRIDPT